MVVMSSLSLLHLTMSLPSQNGLVHTLRPSLLGNGNAAKPMTQLAKVGSSLVVVTAPWLMHDMVCVFMCVCVYVWVCVRQPFCLKYVQVVSSREHLDLGVDLARVVFNLVGWCIFSLIVF